jgi:DNA-binding LacI/PurR family transcriptional regulator
VAKLKQVAEKANVSMLVAFRALSDSSSVEAGVYEKVIRAAEQLNYRLNITQIDVADLAGVAKGTVSYALNDSELISEATRLKVKQAAADLGYRPNTLARNLRKNQAGVVGYSWHVADDPSLMNNLLDRFIYRVTMAAEQKKFHLMTFIQPQVNAASVYDELISTNRVDGFIISDVQVNDARIRRLMQIGAPFVAFGGMYLENPNFAFVDVDGKYGIGLVVRHLVEQGHERIGLLNWPPGWLVGDVREAGYRNAMAEANLEIQPDWIAYTPNILRPAALAAQQLLSARIPPTAIICTNDVMAFGAKTHFDEAGIQLGRDIALSGYDDDPTSEFLGITSVRQPIDQVAERAFHILYSEISGEPDEKRQEVFNPTLVIRQSTTTIQR